MRELKRFPLQEPVLDIIVTKHTALFNTVLHSSNSTVEGQMWPRHLADELYLIVSSKLKNRFSQRDLLDSESFSSAKLVAYDLAKNKVINFCYQR